MESIKKLEVHLVEFEIPKLPNMFIRGNSELNLERQHMHDILMK